MIHINRNPSRRDLWVFAVCWLLAGLLITARLWWKAYSSTTLTAAGGMSLLALVLAVTWPAALRKLYVGMMIVTYPLGVVISYVILFVVFFGVFWPIGLLLWCLGRDPLDRAWDPTVSSYWSPRPPDPALQRYFQQF